MHAPGIFSRNHAWRDVVARGADWLDYDDTTFAARIALTYLVSRWFHLVGSGPKAAPAWKRTGCLAR